MAVTLTTC